jgi:hypothetical protein
MPDAATPAPAASPSLRHAPLAAAGALHDAALELLSSRGVPVAGETALALLEGAGATADRAAGRVRLPAELVREAAGRAPASFVLPGRTPDRDATVGGGGGGVGPPPPPPPGARPPHPGGGWCTGAEMAVRFG